MAWKNMEAKRAYNREWMRVHKYQTKLRAIELEELRKEQKKETHHKSAHMTGGKYYYAYQTPDGRWEELTGRFKTKAEALDWYNKEWRYFKTRKFEIKLMEPSND